MNEWIDIFKISFVSALAMGLIAIGIGFAVTGEIFRIETANKLNSVSDITYEFQKFDKTWLDKQSSFMIACKCIEKPISLKINTIKEGIVEVDLADFNARKIIENYIDRERFYVRIIENDKKLMVYFDESE